MASILAILNRAYLIFASLLSTCFRNVLENFCFHLKNVLDIYFQLFVCALVPYSLVLCSVGPGLVFVVYPQAVAHMPVSQFWSVLFFLMVFTIGLDSQVCIYVSRTRVHKIKSRWPRLSADWWLPLLTVLFRGKFKRYKKLKFNI